MKRRRRRSVRANPPPEAGWLEFVVPNSWELGARTMMIWLSPANSNGLREYFELLFWPNSPESIEIIPFTFTRGMVDEFTVERFVRLARDEERHTWRSAPIEIQNFNVHFIKFDETGALAPSEETLRELGMGGWFWLQRMFARWEELLGTDPNMWEAEDFDAWWAKNKRFKR